MLLETTSAMTQENIDRCRLRIAGIKYFVSETHFRLLDQRGRRWNITTPTTPKRSVNIDLSTRMSIENIHVLEIGNGENKVYKISMLGISQDNYNHRVMLRGKQTEDHVISQYEQKGVKVARYCIADYLSAEEQVEYLKLLNDENVSLCMQYLRKVEKRLNLQSKKEIQEENKVLVK